MRQPNPTARGGRVAALLAAAALAALVLLSLQPGDRAGERAAGPTTAERTTGEQGLDAGAAQISGAFASGRSGLVVESVGVVERTVPDDNEGDRHQRFIVRLSADHTLLISHNIDLAPRAPVEPGDTVYFRGQYEWNDKGGVIHWTHRDPSGRRPGGWIKLHDFIYR